MQSGDRAVLLLSVVLAACGQEPALDFVPSIAVDLPQDAQPTEIQPGIHTLGSQPISFEANQGQTNSQVLFLSKVKGYNLYLTGNEIVFDVVVQEPIASETMETKPGESTAVKFTLLGASSHMTAQGVNLLSTVSNYFIGDDPSKWISGIKHYEKVLVKQVYPGIDLLFYGASNAVEHDYIVAPGVDPNQIKMQVVGALELYVAEDGDLEVLLNEKGTKLTVKKPFAYQIINGARVAVEVAYHLLNSTTIEFNLGNYDLNKELIIDPVTLIYSTFLGGTLDDVIIGIDIDGSGNAYTVGYAKSTVFPGPGGPPDRGPGFGNFDAFVTKFDSTGSSVIYASFLGGNGDDLAQAIKVDSLGNAYVVGYTTSNNFPTSVATPSAPLYRTPRAMHDAFVTKLNSSGAALTYSYYIGGNEFDSASHLALDTVSSGCTPANPCPVIVGATVSSSISMTGIQTVFGGGAADAFVMRITSDGLSVTASTYIGGDGREVVRGVTLDGVGNVYVIGEKRSGSTGTFLSSSSTLAPFKSCLSGGAGDIQDGFLVKFPNTLISRTYSGCFGGSGKDGLAGIGLDTTSTNCASAGLACPVVVGTTNSSNNTTNFSSINAYQAANAGSNDVFIAQFTNDATAFNYMTFMGGTGDDEVLGHQSIFIDRNGEAWVTGRTTSTDFPLYQSYQSSLSGATSNAFVLKLAGPGTAANLSFSTYLGGTISGKNDFGVDIVVDPASKNAYITGAAESSNFPTVNPYSSYLGGKDGFLAKMETLPITVINSATVIGSTTGTSVVINKPTNTAENDVMLAAIVINNDATSINTVPSGWTQLADIPQAGRGNFTDGRLYVFWKLAGASEGTNYTFGTSASVKYVGGIISFRNVNPTTGIHLSNGQATASALTHNTPSLSVTEYNTMIVTFHGMTEGNTWTPPSGMAEQFDIRSGTAGNNDEGLGASYISQASPGATGAKQATADEAGYGMTAIISLSER